MIRWQYRSSPTPNLRLGHQQARTRWACALGDWPARPPWPDPRCDYHAVLWGTVCSPTTLLERLVPTPARRGVSQHEVHRDTPLREARNLLCGCLWRSGTHDSELQIELQERRRYPDVKTLDRLGLRQLVRGAELLEDGAGAL
jgi:hypothetical protein